MHLLKIIYLGCWRVGDIKNNPAVSINNLHFLRAQPTDPTKGCLANESLYQPD